MYSWENDGLYPEFLDVLVGQPQGMSDFPRNPSTKELVPYSYKVSADRQTYELCYFDQSSVRRCATQNQNFE